MNTTPHLGIMVDKCVGELEDRSSLEVMDTLPLVLIALALGLFLGVTLVLVLVAAARAKAQAVASADATIPPGLTTLLSHLDAVAVIVDPSVTVLAASEQAAELDLRVGETIKQDAIRDLARVVFDTGEVATANETIIIGSSRSSARAARSIQTQLRAVRLKNRLALIEIVDVSERERLEQMRRDFVANTSHELKTPVGAITLLAEAISAAADDPERVRRFSERLSFEAQRLSELTAGILDLSRLQSMSQLSDLRAVNIDELLVGAIEANATTAAASDVKLVRGGESGLRVLGDPRILSEAVSNLISNAVAYSSPGSKVGIGASNVDNAVEIVVSDRGIGIAEADQERIFERFYRADQARDRRTGGTGLGLTIVKHAVERHGGSVRVWSRPGIGSTFTIRVPYLNE